MHRYTRDEIEDRVRIAAAAIANARGARHGAPAITNVLRILPHDILAEVMDDARAVIAALDKPPTDGPTREVW